MVLVGNKIRMEGHFSPLFFARLLKKKMGPVFFFFALLERNETFSRRCVHISVRCAMAGVGGL